MKLLFVTLLAVFAFSADVSAQKTTDKTSISTPTIQCDNCKARIEKVLMKEYGVTAVKVDVKKKTTTVTWIKDRTNIENIKTAIANAGYDADDVSAEETAYRRLPKCCKKPATAITTNPSDKPVGVEN